MGIDAAKLQEIFSSYCNVLSAEILDAKELSADSLKQGMLQVDDYQQAELAAMALNGAVLRDGHRPIKVQYLDRIYWLALFLNAYRLSFSSDLRCNYNSDV